MQMQTYNSYYEQELTKLIDAEINRISEVMFSGTIHEASTMNLMVDSVRALKLVRDELMPMADKKCQEK